MLECSQEELSRYLVVAGSGRLAAEGSRTETVWVVVHTDAVAALERRLGELERQMLAESKVS